MLICLYFDLLLAQTESHEKINTALTKVRQYTPRKTRTYINVTTQSFHIPLQNLSTFLWRLRSKSCEPFMKKRVCNAHLLQSCGLSCQRCDLPNGLGLTHVSVVNTQFHVILLSLIRLSAVLNQNVSFKIVILV